MQKIEILFVFLYANENSLPRNLLTNSVSHLQFAVESSAKCLLVIVQVVKKISKLKKLKKIIDKFLNY